MEYKTADILTITDSKEADQYNIAVKELQDRPFLKAVVFKSKIEPSYSDFATLCHTIDAHPRVECLGLVEYHSELKEAETKPLAEWISKATKLKKLCFKDRLLSNECWKLIFDTINSSTSITSLSFDYQNSPRLGFQHEFNGVEHLIQTIKTNTTIRALSICINTEPHRLKPITASLLENKTITDVKLSKLFDSDCSTLQRILQQNDRLKALHINDSMIKSDGLKILYDGLRENKSLTSFGFVGNPVSDEGSQWIIRMLSDTKLTSLTLENVGLTPKATRSILEAVKCHRSLKKLSLAKNELNSLASLICDVLKVNTTLEALDLTKCNLQGQMEIIANGLKENNTLQKLLIGDNELHVDDVEHICSALHENKGLTSLNMSRSAFLQHNSGQLCAVVEKNKALIDVEANVKGWIYGYTTRLKNALQVNRKHQNAVVVERAIIILNIARTKPRPLLPEIWITIFSFISSPGIHINWGHVVSRAFVNPNRLDITKIENKRQD